MAAILSRPQCVNVHLGLSFDDMTLRKVIGPTMIYLIQDTCVPGIDGTGAFPLQLTEKCKITLL